MELVSSPTAALAFMSDAHLWIDHAQDPILGHRLTQPGARVLRCGLSCRFFGILGLVVGRTSPPLGSRGGSRSLLYGIASDLLQQCRSFAYRGGRTGAIHQRKRLFAILDDLF